MTNSDNNDIDLDVFFNAAKEPLPEPSARLMANIIADAGEIAAARVVVTKPTPQKTGWLARILEPLGGLRGGLAVAACTVFGVTVGYAGTDTIQSLPGVGDIVASITGDPFDDFSYGAVTGYADFLSEG